MTRNWFYLIAAAILMWQPDVLAQTLEIGLRRHVFPQKLLFDCPDPFTAPVPDKVISVGPFRATIHPPNTRGSGPAQMTVLPQGGTGFRIPLSFAGCKIWTADLDKNGKPDLIIATWEAANGPATEVTLVLSDSGNRPVVWHSRVADYDFEAYGLENLVDLDGNGQAELLVPEIDGLDRVHARRGDRSIEAIIRYAISTNGLKRIDGPFAGWAFPILRPRSAKDVMVEDWSTYVDPGPSGLTIKSILPRCPKPMIRLDAPQDYECRITVSDGTVLLGRPDIMVIDGPDGRGIEFSSVEKIDQMVEEARVGGYEIRFTCKSRVTFCQPFLLWATEKKNPK
jgi:hypothetical protein